jgi:hypothetical protein
MSGRGVIVSDGIASVDDDAWDAATGNTVSMERGLLGALEKIDALDLPHRYFLGGEGGLHTAASGCIRRAPAALHPFDSLMFGRARDAVRALGGSLGPLLQIGPDLGYDTTLQSAPGGVDDERRRAALHELCAAVEAEAGRESLSLCISRVVVGASPLASVLDARGYAWTSERPTAWLPVEWNDADGYVARLGAWNRKAAQNARREIDKFSAGGARLQRIDDPADHAARIDALLHAHEERKNAQRLGYRDAFVAALAAAMRGHLHIYMATKDGRVSGAAILLRRGPRGSMALIGMDPEREARDFSYFNTAYYGPAADAPQLGLQRIDFGPGLLPAKQRRGCRVESPRLYYRDGRRLRRPWSRFALAAHRRWFARKFGEIDGAPGAS